MGTLYRKTLKGTSEIETRAFRLQPRLRQALILVDGHRTDSELKKLILSEPDATLAGLLSDGFIEVSAVVADPPVRSAPKPAPEAPRPASKPVDSVAEVRRDAVRALTDQLGPAAEALCLKIEKAKSAAELRPVLVMAAQTLANLRGASAAQSFSARFLADE